MTPNPQTTPILTSCKLSSKVWSKALAEIDHRVFEHWNASFGSWLWLSYGHIIGPTQIWDLRCWISDLVECGYFRLLFHMHAKCASVMPVCSLASCRYALELWILGASHDNASGNVTALTSEVRIWVHKLLVWCSDHTLTLSFINSLFLCIMSSYSTEAVVSYNSSGLCCYFMFSCLVVVSMC